MTHRPFALASAAVILAALAVAPPADAGKPAHEFKNCTDMHKTYPHGVGKPGSKDATSGTPDTLYKRSTPLYNANRKSDRDGDGIACEAA